MKSGVTLGVERPVQSNPQILRLDEDSGEVRLWKGEMERTFRYCLVPVSGSLSSETCIELLRQLGLTKLPDRKWIVGWSYHSTGQAHIRSRFICSSLKKTGWSIYVREDLGLAEHAFSEVNVAVPSPESTRRELQGFLIVFGQPLSLQSISSPPFEATMRHFCRTQLLQPSREFLEGLVQHGVVVAYTSTASDLRTGLVLIGPETEAPDLLGAQESGLVGRILHGDSAALVWDLAPE